MITLTDPYRAIEAPKLSFFLRARRQIQSSTSAFISLMSMLVQAPFHPGRYSAFLSFIASLSMACLADIMAALKLTGLAISSAVFVFMFMILTVVHTFKSWDAPIRDAPIRDVNRHKEKFYG